MICRSNLMIVTFKSDNEKLSFFNYFQNVNLCCECECALFSSEIFNEFFGGIFDTRNQIQPKIIVGRLFCCITLRQLHRRNDF